MRQATDVIQKTDANKPPEVRVFMEYPTKCSPDPIITTYLKPQPISVKHSRENEDSARISITLLCSLTCIES
jgi:hypothetical protein